MGAMRLALIAALAIAGCSSQRPTAQAPRQTLQESVDAAPAGEAPSHPAASMELSPAIQGLMRKLILAHDAERMNRVGIPMGCLNPWARIGWVWAPSPDEGGPSPDHPTPPKK